MKTDDFNGSKPPPVISSGLVIRSDVPQGLSWSEYRQHLRNDFFYSCAYCTMTEWEAHGIRFTIDHYEPQKARPDLVNEYSNLLYACDVCNERKGDRCPPPEARKDGHRFFRPDQDAWNEHFERANLRIQHKTNTGFYSIAALDLNRPSIRKLRELRARLHNCDVLIAEGVLALRRFQIDQLPRSVKGHALRVIRKADAAAIEIANEIDTLLRSFARSTLIDPNTEPEAKAQAEARASQLKQLEVLYPGNWRAPRKKSERKNRRRGS